MLDSICYHRHSVDQVHSDEIDGSPIGPCSSWKVSNDFIPGGSLETIDILADIHDDAEEQAALAGDDISEQWDDELYLSPESDDDDDDVDDADDNNDDDDEESDDNEEDPEVDTIVP